MDFETDITDEGTKENYSNIPNACWGANVLNLILSEEWRNFYDECEVCWLFINVNIKIEKVHGGVKQKNTIIS